MRERGLITPNGEVADLVDKSFADYVNGKDADKNDQIDESNKRRFKKKLKDARKLRTTTTLPTSIRRAMTAKRGTTSAIKTR